MGKGKEKINYPMDRRGLEKESKGNGSDSGNEKCFKTYKSSDFGTDFFSKQNIETK